MAVSVRPILLILAVALVCWQSGPAFAQAPAADDPTVLAPTTGAVPGRLSRPNRGADGAPAAVPGGVVVPDGAAPAAPPGGAVPPSVIPTGPVAAPPGAPSEPAAGPGAAAAPSGPPVLDPLQVAPDMREPRENFEEGFDPLNPPPNVRVNIDFREAELQDVVMWISALTGRNFIIADTINASKKITIISPQPVSIGEAYRAFLAALSMNGLTVVPFGRFLKIVEATGAERQVLTPSTSLSQVPDDDRMVTHIQQLAHVSIATVQPVLDALKSSAASIIAYEPTNSLIITENGSNLRRLLGLLESLDVPSGQDQIHMYQARYASAEDLKTLLLEVFGDNENQAEAAPPEPRRRRSADADPAAAPAAQTAVAAEDGVSSVRVTEIISDDRTNQLIIIANDRSYDRILDLIAHLDVPIPGEGQIHVLFLENASATDLASTLQSLTQSVQDMQPEQNAPANQAAAAAATATFSGQLTITADEATNALVVVASLRDFLSLRTVIDQLDRRRQQVYVEAVVMEVTLNRQNSAGLVWHTGAPGPTVDGNRSLLFGATSVGGLSSLSLDPTSLTGLTVGLQGPTLAELFDISSPILGGLPSIGAVLQAAQTDNNVNILSTPHLLTLDNEEAEIVVGENIPFISGINSGLGNLGSLAGSLGGAEGLDLGSLGNLGGLSSLGGLGGVSVQRQDVALTLRITPQINESNYVRLEIEQEVEDVQSIDPVLGPRTTTRQVRTTVVVQDQQTIVIGGLMRDTLTEDISKVPFLGDIPLIGRLFRHTSTRNAKTNLLLMLTPYIIRDSADFQEIFRRKMEEREQYMSYFGRRDAEFVAAVDYARKRGPLESIHQTIRQAVVDEEARQRAFAVPTVETPTMAPVGAPLRVDFGTAPPTADAPSPTGETPVPSPALAPADATTP